MSRIFISYKRKNKKQVVGIVNQIEGALNEKCFMDYNEIETNAYFLDIICKAIDDSEVVLFMHSSLHNKIDYDNDWTMKEYRYAKEKGKNVVLVKLDNSKLDNVFLFEFGSRNYVDSHDQDQVDRLIKDLAKWLKIKVVRKTDQPAPKPEPIQKKQPEQEPEVKPDKESTQTSRQDSHPHVSYRWLFVAAAGIIVAVIFYPFIYKTNTKIVDSNLIDHIGDSTQNSEVYDTVPNELNSITMPVKSEVLPQPAVPIPSQPVATEIKKAETFSFEATGVISGHDYVDLGLSVLWATCNIGANSPEQVGNYYAWGETETKAAYNNMSYRWIEDDSLTKYDRDSKNLLEKADDVANVKWGEGWKIPSVFDYKELMEKCKWEWKSIKGIDGYLITSKVDGYENRCIFLPVAGKREGNRISSRTNGYYWANSVKQNAPTLADLFYFDAREKKVYGDYRYVGRSIRAVSSNN